MGMADGIGQAAADRSAVAGGWVGAGWLFCSAAGLASGGGLEVAQTPYSLTPGTFLNYSRLIQRPVAINRISR